MDVGIIIDDTVYDLQKCFPFEIVEISGLNPPVASIASSPLAEMDGELVTNSRLTKRNILLTLNLLPPLFNARRELYRCFQVGEKIELTFKENDLSVITEGYVESVEFSQFSQTQLPVISILCPDPFLYDAEAKVYADITSGITVENTGRAVGATFRVSFNASSSSFTLHCNGHNFAVNYSFISADVVKVTTMEGKKRVYLGRGSATYDITSSVALNSEWVMLEPGTNTLSAEGAATVRLSFNQRYTGV